MVGKLNHVVRSKCTDFEVKPKSSPLLSLRGVEQKQQKSLGQKIDRLLDEMRRFREVAMLALFRRLGGAEAEKCFARGDYWKTLLRGGYLDEWRKNFSHLHAAGASDFFCQS